MVMMVVMIITVDDNNYHALEIYFVPGLVQGVLHLTYWSNKAPLWGIFFIIPKEHKG